MYKTEKRRNRKSILIKTNIVLFPALTEQYWTWPLAKKLYMTKYASMRQLFPGTEHGEHRAPRENRTHKGERYDHPGILPRPLSGRKQENEC